MRRFKPCAMQILDVSPSQSDAALQETAHLLREKQRLQQEVQRIQEAARQAAAYAHERQEQAVSDVLATLAESSSRRAELEAALLDCVDAVSQLVGIPVPRTSPAGVSWRERLDAVWEARTRALALLPQRQPARARTRRRAAKPRRSTRQKALTL